MVKLRTHNSWTWTNEDPRIGIKGYRYSVPTQAGASDSLNFYIFPEDPDHVLLLTTNERFGYAGLELYKVDPDYDELVLIADCFFQNVEWEIEAANFFDLSKIYQAKALYNYL